MTLKHILTTAALALCLSAQAQYPVMIHSHNDYKRTMPFYEAYSQKLFSIECDMFYKDGQFLVGHDEPDLKPERSFDLFYLQPLVTLYKLNGGHAWADSDRPIQLMLEAKSSTEEFMPALVKKLEQYPEVFNPEVNPNACRIVITGEFEPEAKDFCKYPKYITFDGDFRTDYTPEQLQQVAMLSTNFGAVSQWNGKGTLIRAEEAKVKALIKRAHDLGKPIRLWGAPESVTAWNTFYNFGVDYINTDNPAACAEFFSRWDTKNYTIGAGNAETAEAKVITNDRLDKITRRFSGFQSKKMQLKERQDTYTPTYRNDGANKPVKNVIMLIGDGMGIAEAVAAHRVNFGLTMFNMKHMGLSETSALDAFTTCSAAGGSALATGVKTSNRHIAAQDNGTPNPSLTDFFYAKQRPVGVVTLGNSADATPAVFYAHCTERDSSDAITRGLLDGKLTLLAGSGYDEYSNRRDGINIVQRLKDMGYKFTRNTKNLLPDAEKTICIDEAMGQAANVDNLGLLGDVTRKSIQKLDKAAGGKGFFLMVEGAKIDYAGHSKYFPGNILETLSFDKAIAEALRFADSNGETLVIVTADHETGGLTLIDGDNNTGHVTAYYVSNDHTPLPVPIFAYGPQAQRFIGVMQNTEICNRIKAIFKK